MRNGFERDAETWNIIQETVADILVRFMFSNDWSATWDEIYDDYGLHNDPFTFCPVSDKEYDENCKEFEEQMYE